MDWTGTLSGHEGEQQGRKGAEFLYHCFVSFSCRVDHLTYGNQGCFFDVVSLLFERLCPDLLFSGQGNGAPVVRVVFGTHIDRSGIGTEAESLRQMN